MSSGDGRSATIGTELDSRHNALNLIRLVLALSVIVWHSFPLTGSDIHLAPVKQLMSKLAVDGFFTISGYLITKSWFTRSDWRAFLWARVLRIMPAFYASMLATVFVLAPLSLLIAGGRLRDYDLSSGLHYLLVDAALWVNTYTIHGTLTTNPFPGAWNGSMWTLPFEFLCYLGVLGLGVLGLLRYRYVTLALFVAAVGGVLISDAGLVGNIVFRDGSKFGVMFLAGALLYQFRDRVPVRGWLIVLAAVLTVAAAVLPDYRMVNALPLAYTTVCLGALGKRRWMNLRQDFSYGTYIYAFPIMQTLVVLGAARLGVAGMALVSIVCTLPIAAASWFLIEKPMLRLKLRRRPGGADVNPVPELLPGSEEVATARQAG